MSEATDRWRFGDYLLAMDQARLLRDGKDVALQPLVLQALAFLVTRAGDLVRKEELVAALWPDTFVSDEALAQVVRKLRVALGDDRQAPRYLETVPRLGYRFIAPVAVVAREAPGVRDASPESAGPRPAPVPPAARPLWNRLGAWAAAALLFLVTVSLVLQRRQHRTGGPVGDGASSAPPTSIWRTAEREQDPAVANDGSRVVYAAARAGQLDLYERDLAGAGVRRLTATAADEYGPRWAPDGTGIAFTREQTHGAPVVWSLRGNVERLITEGTLFDWSPDGAALLVGRAVDGGTRLLRFDLGDGRETLLAEPDGPIGCARFSGDGSVIAYNDEIRLWWLPAAGGEPQRFGPESEYMRCLSWEADGAGVVTDATWGEGRANLWRVSWPAGDEPRALTHGGGGSFQPERLPHDQGWMFVQEHKRAGIWRLDGTPTLLEAPPSIACFAATGDGGLVASDADLNSGEGSLFALEPETGTRHPLAAGLCPAVSADGRQVAYWGSLPAGAGLWRLDRSSRRRTRVWTPPPGFESTAKFGLQPAWSPDGNWLAIASPVGTVPQGLLLFAAREGATQAPPALLAPGRFSAPAFSPDQRWIAVAGTTAAGSGLHLIELATRQSRRLTERRSYRASPLWDADSQAVWILVDETTEPALLGFDLEGRALARRPLAPGLAGTIPSFWGLFAIARSGDSWLALIEQYDADLVMLRDGA